MMDLILISMSPTFLYPKNIWNQLQIFFCLMSFNFQFQQFLINFSKLNIYFITFSLIFYYIYI